MKNSRDMPIRSLLVANRGEIAVRILRAAAELGIRGVAIHSEDDALSLHVRRADEARALRGSGPAAYLDGEQILAIAREAGCDAVHPGYGFLSENAAFAKAVEDAGLRFVGPTAETLELLGDKARARELAERTGVPVLPGTKGPASLEDARAFLDSLGEKGAIVIKAVAGGGGRGMRVVRSAEELDEAYERCRSEAGAAFGNDAVYVETLLPRARHVEVQVVGDGKDVVHLGERECTIQRRHQKLVEVAPSPALAATVRERLLAAAVRMAGELRYRNAGTFEFLVDASDGEESTFAFIEANPRLQVEHTVTEEVTGVDLVKTQLDLAAGRSLAEVSLDRPPPGRGIALEVRVNLERIDPDGQARPTGGTLAAFEPPFGPGVRVDTFGYAGYRTSPRYDSLLAKVVAHAPSGALAEVASRAYRALSEFRIEGVETNLPFLQNLLRHPRFVAGDWTTGFLEEHREQLVPGRESHHRQLYFHRRHEAGQARNDDPLAVLDHGENAAGETAGSWTAARRHSSEAPENTVPVSAEMQGTIVSIDVAEGEEIHAGGRLLVMEAMKMEHVIAARTGGVVRGIAVAEGDTVFEGDPLVFLEESDVTASAAATEEEIDLDAIRPDLAEAHERHRLGLDEARPEAVERRRRTGQRTARENIDDLCDPGSFVEYGPLAIAAQRRRRELDDLIRRTPADGLVTGIGSVNGNRFDEARSRCVVMSYDYTVLAGTQGFQNHRKKDRMFEIAEKWRLPVVFFTEGGGGRPGDTDAPGVAGLDCWAFHLYGRLSGLVPLVGINSGRCFAGNAAILGCCDVVIATENSTIGMGGPAMIEGGGLGRFRPGEVGPMSVQVPNGVVDVPVADEAEAVRVAKQYLSYFQGPLDDWDAADPRWLRRAIPENRLRVYDVRSVIDTLADRGSVLELRRHFGPGMVTALARIEGRPLGIIANNPTHLAGAIDSTGADKAARFMQLCDAHDLPLLFLCDTPGIMVGPEAEKTALVRHASRMFVTGASLTVPFFTIVLRKGYGLGAQAMAGGSFKAPLFTVAWPTGEFGGMGLEGAVKLGYRKELEAINDPEERQQAFERMVAAAYEHGKGLNMASHFEIDEVIDPVDSRRWIVNALGSVPPPPPRTGKKRPCIDTW